MKKKIGEEGFSVAFLGQDGAGKSTVSDQIRDWLNWKIEAKKFYLGSGDHYHSLLKRIKVWFEGENAIKKSIWAILNIFDLTFLSAHNRKIVLKARRYIEKGGIALFDRFPQNVFIGINDGPKIRKCYYSKYNNKLYKSIISFFSNREEKNIEKCINHAPDVVIKLMLSPEESIRRKPEEDIENVREKHEIIKSLSFTESEVYVLDATMPYEDEILIIKRIIWNIIKKKAGSYSESNIGKL